MNPREAAGEGGWHLHIGVHKPQEQAVEDEGPQGVCTAHLTPLDQAHHALCQGHCKGGPFCERLV